MQFKSIIFTFAASIIVADKCPAPSDNCGYVGLTPGFNPTMSASFYPEPNFKGEPKNITINGIYECSNDIPDFQIKSLLSTGTTQVTLHYGKDCIGHVIKQMMGGSSNLESGNGCPGSVFIKLNRYGSC